MQHSCITSLSYFKQVRKKAPIKDAVSDYTRKMIYRYMEIMGHVLAIYMWTCFLMRV